MQTVVICNQKGGVGKGCSEPQKAQQKKENEADPRVNLTLRFSESVRKKLKLYTFEHSATISQMLMDLADKLKR